MALSLYKEFNQVTKNVVGQDEAVKKMLLTVSNNLDFGKYNKQNVLLSGKPGSGKTLLTEEVARALNIPFWNISATFDNTGIKYFLLKEAFKNFYQQQNSQNLKGIVLLSNYDDIIFERNIDFSLVKNSDFYLENIEGSDHVNIDGVTFVCEGVFDQKHTDRLNSKAGCGFNAEPELTFIDRIQDGSYQSNLLSYFPALIQTNQVDEAFIENVLNSSEISAWKQFCQMTDYPESDTIPPEIVQTIMDKGTGLHSASAVCWEVNNDYVEEKIFSETGKQKVHSLNH